MEVWQMGDLPMYVIGAIGIILAFFLIKLLAGIIFRVIILILLAAFLFYLYKSGAHQMILAPGAPGSEMLGSLILI